MSTTESALVFIAINSFLWTLSLVNLQMDLREIRRTMRDVVDADLKDSTAQRDSKL